MRTIDEIRASCEAATKGPWEVGYGGYDVYSVSCDVTVSEGDVDEDIDPEEVGPNAEFIAHARQDVPDLLAELAEKDAEIERLEANVERLREMLKKIALTSAAWEREYNGVAELLIMHGIITRD